MNLQKALEALGEKAEFYACQPISLVVCGGTALNVLGFLDRPTKDVDVVALATEEGGEITLQAPEIPNDLLRCIQEVAEDFGLPPNWVNAGPAELYRRGLPEGIGGRLRSIDFGSRLRVHFVGRQDLVFMKLYAAASRGGRQAQHSSDLEALDPSHDELEKAIDWAVQQDGSEEFRHFLKRHLTDMGHDDLAYYV